MKDDIVPEMPGWGKQPYNIYSGMLDADASGSRTLHYVLLES